MKRNLTRQADLQLRRFCHRLTVKQRKAVLWILFVPFAAACVYTACRPFIGSKNRESGMEFMEKDSLRMEFIQSIVRNGERKVKKVMERLMKPFRLRSSKDRKPLSEEQKRKRAGFVVYPLMFLLCLGSFYLIFSPSGQERGRQDKGQGFNTEIPSPEDSRLEGNKKDAYEKALMEQESRKRKTFFEAAESMFAKEERKDSVRLPDNIPPERKTNTETETEKGNAGPVSSSAGAYREMNRTLGSIYEPRTDPEKERLLERIEELERMQQQQQKQEPLSGMEEKMALMENPTNWPPNTITVRQWRLLLPSEKWRTKSHAGETGPQ